MTRPYYGPHALGGRTRAQEEDAWLPARPAVCSRSGCSALAVEDDPRPMCTEHHDQATRFRALVLAA